MYDYNDHNNTYISLAVANREPIRRDFRESTPENEPSPENLLNVELGYRYKGRKLMINANAYYMYYRDQLVLTGQINDVGDYTRTNVDKSYRAGIELEAGYRITKNLSFTKLINSCSGFIYLVSHFGRTGHAINFEEPKLLRFYKDVREATSKPLMAGFGIKRAQDADTIFTRSTVDGVILGSGLCNIIEEFMTTNRHLPDLVQEFLNPFIQAKSIPYPHTQESVHA